MEKGEWKVETKLLEKSRFKHILGTPRVVEFNGWKEEAAKYLISWYHNGYLWLNYLVKITRGLIQKTIGISHGGMPITKTTNTNE
jgi:hypothetical protein